MSLTTQLHGGELAAWCAAQFTGTVVAVAQVHAAVRTARKLEAHDRCLPDLHRLD